MPSRQTPTRPDEGGSEEEATRSSSAAAQPAAGLTATPAAPGAPGDGLDDHALVRRAQKGDPDAFEALVQRHEGRAFRVARNMVPSDEDARDLAQDAFLRVFKSLERFDFQHEFTTWLYRIVTNLAIDQLRKRRPTVSTQGVRAGDDDDRELDLPDPDAEDPSRRLESFETVRAVRECIDSLAPHFQTVLTLRELEGLPCTEIAKIVGATHVTVRWRLHRGRKLFQEEWERRTRLAANVAATQLEGSQADFEKSEVSRRAGANDDRARS